MNLKLLDNKKILIIAAHPDDEMLGCGGTIIKLKKDHEIQVVFLTNGILLLVKSVVIGLTLYFLQIS